MKLEKTFEDCYATLDDTGFTIGNSRIERSWSLKGAVPQSLSLKNKDTGKEWFADKTPEGWLSAGEDAPAFIKTNVLSGKRTGTSAKTDTEDDLGFAAGHLIVEVELEYEQIRLKWRHIVYPRLPILRSRILYERKTRAACGKSAQESGQDHRRSLGRNAGQDPGGDPGQNRGGGGNPGNPENTGTAAADPAPSGNKPYGDDYIDMFPSLPHHCKWKAVGFRDVTDRHNNLVSTEEGLFYGGEKASLSGNVLFVRDLLSEDGFMAIKEGPTPLAYQGDVSHDFEIFGNNIVTAGWGFGAEEWKGADALSTDGSAVVLWEGNEEEALTALQRYHRALHTYRPERDAFVMCNTWGDRSKSVTINEDFIKRELSIAKRLGISCYQIDYGWQEAASQGGIEGYYNANPNYWDINKKGFPGGFRPIVEAAENSNVDMGLWFSPDSSNDFCNWEKDAEVLTDLHKKYDIKAFKLDAVNIRSKKGEENLYRMMRKVVRETNGEVSLNLDITAQARSGYFGRTQYTSFFLENRYTDWHNYYPHWALRNLWMLSKYYPTFRLQVEFPNVNRNKGLYEGDPLAPSVCGIEYAFAVTMFSNPLAWMTLTGLDEESLKILEKVIPVYRKYQADILSGYILPIGEEPSGTSWTGFQSVTGEGKGYLLIIKELNDTSLHTYKLWKIKDQELRLRKLIGRGEDRIVKADGDGRANFYLEGKFQYSLYSYEQVGGTVKQAGGTDERSCDADECAGRVSEKGESVCG